MSVGKMAGKRVLVTGAGTGIGRGIALEMGQQGADVVLHYSASADGAKSAVEEIRNAGQRSTAIQADFREFEPMEELVAKTTEFLGGVDVLVNNAGITNNVPFEEITPKHWDTLFSVNVRAQFFVTRALVPELEKQQKAYVINLTSVHAFSGMTEHSVYAATKGAVVAFTREVAVELIQKGIRVNAIAPGWIRVENQEITLGEAFDWENEPKILPAGHCGVPTDIANLAIFLASEESRFIIGQTLVADGGQLAVMPMTGDFRKPRDVAWGKSYV